MGFGGRWLEGDGGGDGGFISVSVSIMCEIIISEVRVCGRGRDGEEIERLDRYSLH